MPFSGLMCTMHMLCLILQVIFTDCINCSCSECLFQGISSRVGDWGIVLYHRGWRMQRGFVEAFGATLRLRGGGWEGWVGAHKVPISYTTPPVNCPLSPETRETSAFFFLGKFCQHPISLLSSDQLDLTESLLNAINFYPNNVHVFNFLPKFKESCWILLV